MPEQGAYSNFRWTYFSSLQDGPLRARAESFLGSVNWDALLEYATRTRGRSKCALLSHIGLGYNHMVRIIEFEDGARWVARLRMPSPEGDAYPTGTRTAMESESCTASLVLQRTNVPVPKMHALETSDRCDVKAPFMLMECLEGNVGLDLGLTVPSEHKQAFYKELAEIHVALLTIQLPQIGTILSVNDDGTFKQGAIPGVGGPFDTATEFFQAWSEKANFGMSEERLRAASGQFGTEIVSAVSSFPQSIYGLANRLSTHDTGPFPLHHGDFGHNNIIVNDEYHVLGVIDWEAAFAAPWEIAGAFPLTLSTLPPAMDVPWNYDEHGNPKDAELTERFADQAEYIRAVREAEDRLGITSNRLLSKTLADSTRQQMITAMRLYQNGTAGFYSRLIDRFSSS